MTEKNDKNFAETIEQSIALLEDLVNNKERFVNLPEKRRIAEVTVGGKK
jgi:hypothetical protein